MADERSSEDRTEEATPRRQEQAREEGQVPRSRELSTSVLMLAGSGCAIAFSGWVANSIGELTRRSLGLRADWHHFDDVMLTGLVDATWVGLKMAVPFLIVLLVAGLFSSTSLGGLNFSTKSIAFNGSRLSPMAGIKRMFGLSAWVELGKSLLKFVVVGVPVAWILYDMTDEFVQLPNQAVHGAIAQSLQLIAYGFLGMAAATIIIALVDVPYQLFDYSKKLRMSFQEIKEELKNTEGRPEVKARIRRVAQEISRRRMMQDVPKADVIITNPEHYAVALKYDSSSMAAPKVLAKGVDLLAQQIRWIGSTSKVPEVRSPALARSLYYSTEVGMEVPSGLYLAVAQVLAYVFQLARYRQGYAPQPVLADDLPIPPELRRD